MSDQKKTAMRQEIDDLTTDALKARFRARSIPLESDFANLIDVADCGRKAVGLSPGQGGPGSGLNLSTDTGLLSVKTGAGIKIEDTSVCVEAGPGISVTDRGVGVVAGPGIKIENNVVCLDPLHVLPAGVIMMFNGKAIPNGWRLCDGSNGTPNLIDKFVLGGGLSNIGQANNRSMSANFPKECNATSVPVQPAIKMTNAAFTLTSNEMPAHSHLSGTRLSDKVTEQNAREWSGVSRGNTSHRGGLNGGAGTGSYLLNRSETVGGGRSHTHNNSATQDPHSHSMNIVPPYYVLVFIIKV
ncbi:hypothetical protein [Burkholderia ubonensis]|uniref:hypothetical protein n=1 Tax=Burkholderia ubonensis TaxID=101571 RepID=UPI000B2B1366|nr:hypothetical protein [Burkholderia ubonensis]